MDTIDKIRNIVEANSLDTNFNDFNSTSYKYDDILSGVPNDVFNYIVM